jgi:GT2 family glycosyltransferase
VLLLNADARLHPDAISQLLSAVTASDDAVVACPRMYLGNSNDEVKRLWFAYGTVKFWAGLFQNPAFNQIDSPAWSVPQEMEFASGCCMMIPARILRQAGMLDESFFAYCEDIDFSIRVRQNGFRLLYVPSAFLWHGSAKATVRTRSAFYRYLSTRNNLWVVRKYAPPLERIICMCILPIRSLYRLARIAIAADWNSIGAEVKGVRDGILMRVKSQ